MRAAYSLFKGDSTEEDLAKQMDIATDNDTGKSKRSVRAGVAYFYANLYLGLYAEAKGDEVLSRKCENAKAVEGDGREWRCWRRGAAATAAAALLSMSVLRFQWTNFRALGPALISALGGEHLVVDLLR